MDTTQILQQMLSTAETELAKAKAELERFDGMKNVERQALQLNLEQASQQVNALREAVQQVE